MLDAPKTLRNDAKNSLRFTGIATRDDSDIGQSTQSLTPFGEEASAADMFWPFDPAKNAIQGDAPEGSDTF